jgi:hypothetical protein
MCGHIQKAEDRMIGEMRYLNSGDWVESLTAIVEEADGRLRVVDRAELRTLIAAQRAAFEAGQAGAPKSSLPATVSDSSSTGLVSAVA